jgi:hypothetical protein
MTVAAVKVTVVGWHENHPPGIVECSLVDRRGRDWRIALKYYDATKEELSPDSEYPLLGSVLCQILERGVDENGKSIAKIELDVPLENLSENGIDQFEIFTGQLTWRDT